MPEATLAIRRSAFRLLQRGRPLQIDEGADGAGLPVDAAREAVELVASVGMAELDAGTPALWSDPGSEPRRRTPARRVVRPVPTRPRARSMAPCGHSSSDHGRQEPAGSPSTATRPLHRWRTGCRR